MIKITTIFAAAPDRAGPCGSRRRRRKHETIHHRAPAVELCRHLRQVRRAPAAARLPGVPRSLRELPSAPGCWRSAILSEDGWPRLLGGAGQGARRRVHGQRSGAPRAARARACRPTAGRAPGRADARPDGGVRHRAARPVGDGQGAGDRLAVPAVDLQLLHDVLGRRSGLHPRAADGLRRDRRPRAPRSPRASTTTMCSPATRSACRRRSADGQVTYANEDGAAAPAEMLTVEQYSQRRVGVPDVDGRAAPQRPARQRASAC